MSELAPAVRTVRKYAGGRGSHEKWHTNAIDGGVHMENPNHHSGNPFDPKGRGTGEHQPAGHQTGETRRMGQMRNPNAWQSRNAAMETAGLAVPYGGRVPAAGGRTRKPHVPAEREDEISAILAEVAAGRNPASKEQKRTDFDSDSGIHARAAVTAQPRAGRKPGQSPDRQMPRKRADARPGAAVPDGRKRKKKKRKHRYTFKEILKSYIPWRGDSVADAFRKIVFFIALCVVGVCTFLISNYYIGLYRDNEAYVDLQKTLEDTKNRQEPKEPQIIYDPDAGIYDEYFEDMNELGVLLKKNPDLVGHIKIEGTPVDYPVVQKHSMDPNENTNDYYLWRNFAQQKSDSGCIFLDFRCIFDRIVNHRRAFKNSDNLIIYGHNMGNKTMFGSLRDYPRNPIYYKEHPIVELQSLYKTYYYKIFAIFIIDGSDTTSEYAFDCWNTIDFKDEDEFYEYVNNAKKRNMINNDVDVVYGDPILTLYTCNSMVTKEGKLILMCRMIRDDEKGNEKVGTENATLNENFLYPAVYYKNHDQTFDISKFVPYGPKNQD